MLYFLYNINYHLSTLQYNITLSCFFFYQLVKTRTTHFRFYYSNTVLLGKLLSIRITKLCCCKNHSPCFSAFNKEEFFLSPPYTLPSSLFLALSLFFFFFFISCYIHHESAGGLFSFSEGATISNAFNLCPDR